MLPERTRSVLYGEAHLLWSMAAELRQGLREGMSGVEYADLLSEIRIFHRNALCTRIRNRAAALLREAETTAAAISA